MPDREKVIEGLEKVWDAFNHMEHELYADYVFDALALLKEQPEIVRCKDCKHATIHCIESVLGEPLYDCNNPNWNYDDTPTMLWNWFCADGERKEGR